MSVGVLADFFADFFSAKRFLNAPPRRSSRARRGGRGCSCGWPERRRGAGGALRALERGRLGGRTPDPGLLLRRGLLDGGGLLGLGAFASGHVRVLLDANAARQPLGREATRRNGGAVADSVVGLR